MKVLLIAIFAFFGSMFCLNSQTLPTYPPCNSDFVGQPCDVPWSLVPKYDTIWCNQIPPCPSSCPTTENCRFIIQYYDRFINCTGDTNPEWYDVQISYVFTSDSCKACFADLRERLEKKFINRRNQAVKERFKFFWYHPNDPPTTIYCYYQHHFTTKGNCYPTVGDTSQPCSAERCCSRYVKICYDSQGNVLEDLTQISGDLLFPDPILDPNFPQGMTIPCSEIGCDTNSTPKCGKYPVLTFLDIICDSLQCNYGPWTDDSLLVSATEWGCPQCSFWIHFRRRTADCDITFQEVQIQYFQLQRDTICWSCPIGNFTAFYWSSIRRVLRRIGEEDLAFDKCDTSYKVLNYSCWTVDAYDTTIYIPCDQTGCCWARYILCRDENGMVTVTKIDSSSASEDCGTITRPCIYICDEPGMPKIGLEDNDFKHHFNTPEISIKPNPSSGIFNCNINFSNNNMKLIIFNMLGQKIFQKDLKNNKYYVNFDIDISNKPDGIYYYTLEIENEKSISGVILLLK